MAKPGRPRKDPKLAILDRYRSKPDPKPEKRPVLEIKAPRMPADMTEQAKTFWKKTAPLCLKLGTLTEADEGKFKALCMAYARWMRLEKIVDEEGEIIEAHNGSMIHPALEAARRAEQRFSDLAKCFGLDPLSRSKIELPAPVQEQATVQKEKKEHGVDEDLLDE